MTGFLGIEVPINDDGMSIAVMTKVATIVAALFLIDNYVFRALKPLFSKKGGARVIKFLYWFFSMLPVLGIIIYNLTNDLESGRVIRKFLMFAFTLNYLPKFLAAIVLFFNDIYRVMKFGVDKVTKNDRNDAHSNGKLMKRSEFISKVALYSATVPVAVMGFGILSGAYDYRVRRKTIYLPNLPSAFDGIKIGQLSDIHSGSFFDKTAVQGGVEMLMNEKPDLIFFTGDLVNNKSEEVNDYIPVFNKVKAPFGVYSVTGNHDYGDYARWSSVQAKVKNFNDLKEAHRLMGWDLLMNENRYIQQGSDKISIIGIENWGAGRFAKYGKLDEAYQGTDEAAAKILLSHDPSHWDAQVRGKYQDIDLMLSGHTHGFQFGVEIGDFKWSPSQYIYKQWAGLYKDGDQHLYVNRGFGFIGYPGRVGILPEVTILELKKMNS